MQVKKFEAPTMNDALKMIKVELGPDAIILSTKNHRKGFGLLSKASVEVTAAVSEKSLAKKQITERMVAGDAKDEIAKLSASKQKQIFDRFGEHMEKKKNERQKKQALADEKREAEAPRRYVDIQDEENTQVAQAGYGRNGKARGDVTPVVQQKAASALSGLIAGAYSQDTLQMAAPVVTRVPDEGMSSLQTEVDQLKAMIAEMRMEQSHSDTRTADLSSDELDQEFQNLLRNGIEKKSVSQLLKEASFNLSKEELHDSAKIIENIAIELMAKIKTADPLSTFRTNEPLVFALVGPTGVGKTTTIAKLASMALLQKNFRVGLINLDSYKIAATDQLATYAKILNMPFRQATNSAELERALSEFKPLDLVLIDTSGRSQRDSENLNQMKALLQEFVSIRPLLIMSATTRDADLYDIANRFKIFNPTGIIFSKLDEAVTFGSIFNVAVKTQYPLTYFTVGQRVPEDIETASKERLASLILDLS